MSKNIFKSIFYTNYFRLIRSAYPCSLSCTHIENSLLCYPIHKNCKPPYLTKIFLILHFNSLLYLESFMKNKHLLLFTELCGIVPKSIFYVFSKYSWTINMFFSSEFEWWLDLFAVTYWDALKEVLKVSFTARSCNIFHEVPKGPYGPRTNLTPFWGIFGYLELSQ